jgi:hypothetical protein
LKAKLVVRSGCAPACCDEVVTEKLFGLKPKLAWAAGTPTAPIVATAAQATTAMSRASRVLIDVMLLLFMMILDL